MCALFKFARCVKELLAWMVRNKLMVNPDEPEFFIASSVAHRKRPEHLTFDLEDVEIHPAPSVNKSRCSF